MKLSPLDLEHQEFDNALSGYNKRQVRDFLSRAAAAFETLVRDNQALHDELARRDKRIEELSVTELELKRAVIAAERIGNELKQNARREAELIVQEAQASRDKLMRDTENAIRVATDEQQRLEGEARLFREQFRGMLKAYERSLDNVPHTAQARALPE